MLKKTVKTKISKEFNLEEQEVEKLYDLYWKAIKEYLCSLEHEDFNSYKAKEFSIPGLGKLQINDKVLKYINEGLKNKND